MTLKPQNQSLWQQQSSKTINNFNQERSIFSGLNCFLQHHSIDGYLQNSDPVVSTTKTLNIIFLCLDQAPHSESNHRTRVLRLSQQAA